MATSAAPAAVVGATTSATRSRPHRHLPPHLPRAFATPTLRRPRALRRRVCATTLGRASVASTRVFSAGPTRAGGPRVRLGTSAAPPTVVNAATSARGCECVSLGRGPRCWDTQAPVSGSDPWRCAYCQDGPGGMYPRFFPRREFAGGRGTGALCTPLCPCWSCRLHAEFAFAVVFFHIIVTSCRGAAQTQYPTGKVQPPATHTRTLCVLWRRAAARELCGLCWYRLLLALASIQLHACATGLRDVCARDRVCSALDAVAAQAGRSNTSAHASFASCLPPLRTLFPCHCSPPLPLPLPLSAIWHARGLLAEPHLCERTRLPRAA
eukprot:TRINITY_DN233_c0_g1_i28.p1 TRINITY_DN233_c0_g1~~TRINITY_DN233_c0_g1_i28.p1  ORF type:complete len:324 (+),score=-45.17 TRINITY_DN233_c0_g1_i28:239-1210(+)